MTPFRILINFYIHLLCIFFHQKTKAYATKNQSKKKPRSVTFPVVNPNAAGIDVGSRSHYVAIGQGKEDVKQYRDGKQSTRSL